MSTTTTTEDRVRRALANTTKGEAARTTLPPWPTVDERRAGLRERAAEFVRAVLDGSGA